MHCCACGKDAALATCVDTEAFTNGKGMTCADYTEKGWCEGGAVAEGAEWTLGAGYNFPETNCCACGKGAALGATHTAPAECTDTANEDGTVFSNGHGLGCADYESKGWCKDGAVVPEAEWTSGEKSAPRPRAESVRLGIDEAS